MELFKDLYWYPENGMMDSNTYIIIDETSVLIDPGATAYLDLLLEGMRKDGIDPKTVDLVIDTHLHPDHSGANRAFMRASGAKLAAYKGVESKYSSRKPSQYFDENLNLGGVALKIFHTPGHSHESISIHWPEEKLLICGDLIFFGGVGRTDFRGGDTGLLKDSIERMSKLGLEYILPGHGEMVWGDVNVSKNFKLIKEMYLSWM
ncbi:MAG: MBL fold metallo-hydrolase [Halobacteriota archaeon]|nr:MBL fold metallo-hydrolase [Halobacteriota archaeon]